MCQIHTLSVFDFKDTAKIAIKNEKTKFSTLKFFHLEKKVYLCRHTDMNRKILHIALPSIVSNITVPLLSLVDTTIVGHLGAACYIGAIAVGGMLFNMVYWLFGFLRMGTGGMTAQAHGAHDATAQLNILVRSLTMALFLALFLILLQRPLLLVAFHFVSASSQVQRLATLYFDILIWGAPAVLSLYSFTGWFLGMQNARFPMAIAIVQNLVNIAVSTLLVFGLGWKVEGVAIGTLVAQYAGLIMAAVLWLKRYRQPVYWHDSTLFSRQAFRRFFSVNSDIFLRTLCLIAVTTYFTSAGSAQGDLTLAANTLLMQFFVIFSYIMDGFAYAGEALGGSFYGASQCSLFHLLTRRLFLWGTGLALLFSAVYFLLGTPLLHLLTSDNAVIVRARHFLPFVYVLPLVSFAAFLFDGLFIGTTSTRFMLVSMAVAAAAFFAVILTFPNNNTALWSAFLLYLGCRGAVQGGLYGRINKGK